MKDENGIDISCENCAFYNSKYCEAKCTKTDCLVDQLLNRQASEFASKTRPQLSK